MAQEGKDWTTELLDRFDHYIDVVRSNTTERLVRIARLVIFGLIAAILGTVAVVVALIALVRVLNVVLPEEVWLPYIILGAIFLVLGLFLWSKRTAPAPPEAVGRP